MDGYIHTYIHAYIHTCMHACMHAYSAFHSLFRAHNTLHRSATCCNRSRVARQLVAVDPKTQLLRVELARVQALPTAALDRLPHRAETLYDSPDRTAKSCVWRCAAFCCAPTCQPRHDARRRVAPCLQQAEGAQLRERCASFEHTARSAVADVTAAAQCAADLQVSCWNDIPHGMVSPAKRNPARYPGPAWYPMERHSACDAPRACSERLSKHRPRWRRSGGNSVCTAMSCNACRYVVQYRACSCQAC